LRALRLFPVREGSLLSKESTVEHTEGFCFSLRRVPEHSKSLWTHNLLEIRAGEERDNNSEYKNFY
jgi:hypothetical protein